jgi:hypothetical protein
MSQRHDDPYGLSQRPVPARALLLVGILEAASLAVLLLNLAIGHNPGLAQAVGPVHGLLYLVGIALVWANRLPTLSKVLVLVPAVGTLLAVSTGRRSCRGGSG